MDSLGTFLAMGGYGEFIWPAFTLSAIVLIGVSVQSYRFLAATEKELEQSDTQPVETENETEA